MRFVIVEYPKRGHCPLMTTAPSLSALEIIKFHGLRFKRAAFRIEHGFKLVTGVVGVQVFGDNYPGRTG